MSALRESFVTRFGEDQAAAVEQAAAQHRGELLDGAKVGDDVFADNFAVCIGFECVGRYAASHGITVDESDLRDWAVESRVLDRHIGPVDWVSLLAGAYEPWIAEAGDVR